MNETTATSARGRTRVGSRGRLSARNTKCALWPPRAARGTWRHSRRCAESASPRRIRRRSSRPASARAPPSGSTASASTNGERRSRYASLCPALSLCRVMRLMRCRVTLAGASRLLALPYVQVRVRGRGEGRAPHIETPPLPLPPPTRHMRPLPRDAARAQPRERGATRSRQRRSHSQAVPAPMGRAAREGPPGNWAVLCERSHTLLGATRHARHLPPPHEPIARAAYPPRRRTPSRRHELLPALLPILSWRAAPLLRLRAMLPRLLLRRSRHLRRMRVRSMPRGRRRV